MKNETQKQNPKQTKPKKQPEFTGMFDPNEYGNWLSGAPEQPFGPSKSIISPKLTTVKYR